MLGDRAYMRDSSFGSRRSTTAILVILNVAIYVLQMFLGYWHSPSASVLFGNTPGFDQLRQYGLLPLSQYGLAHGYVWQLVTYQFLHGGFLHLLLNMLLVYFFG